MNEIYSSGINRADLYGKNEEYTSPPKNWRTLDTKIMGFVLLLFSLLFSTGIAFAQSTANYVFNTNATGSLALLSDGTTAVDMSTGTTLLHGVGIDSGAGIVTNIGFNFTFMGTTYTQFSASSNGNMSLGSTGIAGTTYLGSGGTTASPRFAALASDAITASAVDGGGVTSKIVGTAPNRCLVVQWVSYLWYQSTSLPATFQVRLYESTGVVEYVYGAMPVGATAFNGSTGFSVGTLINQMASITTSTNGVSYATPFASNSYVANTNIANLHSTANGSRTRYVFTPPSATVATPTSLTFTAVSISTITPNWVDNSTNEIGFSVTRALDAGFTSGVVSTFVASTTSAGTGTAYTLAQTALSAGTTYFYRIQAVTEGVASSGLTGSQATTAGATYYWVGATNGTWGTAANWNTNPAGGGSVRTTPANTDVLIIDGEGFVSGGNLTISHNVAAQSIGQFRVINNTNLTLQSDITTTRTTTVTGGGGDDLVVEAGSTLNLTSATNACAFSFSGTANTGLIAGTYNASGSTSNVITTTGGTGTLVTVASTGVVNNNVVGSSGCMTGSVATLSFADGSNYSHGSFTTSNGFIPLATWGTTSTVTITGGTTSTGITNPGQSFGNFVYNSTTSTATMSVWTTLTTGIVRGNLTITATGTGIFRALTTGTVNINGNVIVNGGTLQSASGTSTFIANGTTTVSAGGILDILAGTYSQRGATFTNNGVITGIATGSTLQFLSFTNTAQTFAGSGTVLTNIATMSLQNLGGLTITHANQIPLLRVNLFGGTITNSNKITFGTGAALNTVVQIGAAGLTTSAGSFDVAPTFNLGTGLHGVTYAQELGARTTGFEIPSARTLSFLTNSNSNGLTIAGGPLATATLTLSALTGGNITTTNANLLTVTGTTVGSIVRTSLTAYVNGPLARTLPASLLTGSTYILPIGKGTLNPFALVNPTTNAGGTVTIRSEVFDAATGGANGNLIGGLNSNRYWASSITAGSANFTDSLIQLSDTPNAADAVAGSATLTGAYDLIGGLTTTTTATTLTSTAPAATSLVGFYVMGTKASATLSNLAISPTGNRCPHVTRDVTVTVTPGGGAITGVVINYSINGVAQTAITMTNTSGDNWAGTIPTVVPTTATVTWSVTATDANAITKNQVGTPYTDGGAGSDIITITPSVPNFCGTGGSVTLTASSAIPGVTYTWQSLTGSASLGSTSGVSVSATITETSDFRVTGTPTGGGCPSVATISVGVYALPTATVTTSANGVCPGTSATINSGLSAGNFLSVPITANFKTAPVTASTLVTAGVATPATNISSGLDDAGWSNIPVGFNFNFFGTDYSTISVGTNGTVFFGASPNVADFSFTTLPSTSEPFNMVAVLAMDNNLAGATGGTIKYWTEGAAPNRKFYVSYIDVQEYGDTQFSSAQAVFTETTGVIEVHVSNSTNVDRNKLVGVNNGTGTVGVLAYTSGITASATNPIASPFAYRFNPPANYSTTWTATNVNGTTTIATGTNIFSQTVSPAITTTYAISYTNTTTGCTNAAGSAQVVMTILGATAPTGVTTLASATSACSGVGVDLSMDYAGSIDGLAFQWQSSINNGVSWQNIVSATAVTRTVNPTVTTKYRCSIISCGGTPSFSSVVDITVDTPTVITVNPAPIDAPETADLTLPAVTDGSSPGLTFTYFTNPAATIAVASPAAVGVGTYYIKGTNASGCSVVTSVIVSSASTTFITGAWTNGVPTVNLNAIIADNFTATADLTAKSLTINSGSVFTVGSGSTVTVANALTNNAEATGLIIENNGVFLQTTTAANSALATVKRTSSPLYRLDYSLWSSPVAGQNLRAFSTQTLFNRFSSYVTSTNAYFQEIVTTADMNTKTFTNAKGYLIRMPNDWVEYTGTAASYQGSFTGTLNNGTVSIPLSGASTGMNLVGNPYPSPISIASLLAANSNITSTMYFWRKKSSGTPGNVASGYATLNALGFTSADGDINGVSPTKIQTGQGFFVVASSASPGNLVFNNTMRTSGSATFYKNSNETNTELHRIWLNLTSGTNVVGQTLIGYATGATQGVDNDFDAPYFNDSPLALTSIINNAEFIIQGRALAFTDTDVVPLGFKTDVAGSYTIALSNFDGVFSGNQDIFLRDITTNTMHNLKTAAYTFTSAVGVFNTRFELRYQGTLDTNNPSLGSSSILIAVKDQQIKINAGSVTMEKVELIDVAGRVIYTLEGVNATTATIENLVSSNQMLIVRISTKGNGVVSQKIIF